MTRAESADGLILKPMSGAVHSEVGTVPFAQALECGRGVDGERLARDGT